MHYYLRLENYNDSWLVKTPGIEKTCSRVLLGSTLHQVKNTQSFHMFYLFFPTTKKMSFSRGVTESEMSYFLL